MISEVEKGEGGSKSKERGGGKARSRFVSQSGRFPPQIVHE